METSSRRKACDLCFKKKIRCDGLKPSCSNCRLYKVPCGTTTARRRTGPASHKTPAEEVVSPKSAEGRKSDDSVEARLSRIEAKLDSLRGSTQGTGLSTGLQSGPDSLGDEATAPLDETPPSVDSSLTWTHPGRSYDQPSVPPLIEVLPVVEAHFRNYNPAVPLFHQRSFMRMLNDYYSQSGEKSRAVGALINIVLAFGYRIRSANNDISSIFGHQRVKKCIDNAQMVLGELMVKYEDTLGIQVLLGLVLLFQANSDQQPSAILISTAVRLAHKLRLHSKAALSSFPPEEAQHRRNIFWICYYLDKDLSFRTRTPSMQLDEDIDVDLPGSDPSDNDSFFQSIDGRSSLHYLRARVKLANIQGRIYDSLYSNRSKKLSTEARQRSVLHLDRLLDQWRRAIPASLQLECVSESLEMIPSLHMITLYQTYMLCLSLTHGLCSLEAPWLKSLDNHVALTLQVDDHMHTCMQGQLPPLPYAWEKCVTASRACVKFLSDDTYLSRCQLWLNVCAYFSAFVFLLANAIYSPSDEFAERDRELIRASMPQMERLLAQNDDGNYKRLRVVLANLEQMAAEAALNAQKSNLWASHAQAAPPLYRDVSSQGQQAIFDALFSEDSALADEPVWTEAPEVSALNMVNLDFTGFDFVRNGHVS